MAIFSGWDRDQPSGASSIRDSDDRLRSHNSILQATLQQEHYFTDGSASSAGVHKLGSARIFSGASSAVSAFGDDGRLMWDTTNSQLVALHAASTTRIPSLAVANTWDAAQTFSAAATFSSTIGVTGAATFGSTLEVAGAATFSGNVQAKGTSLLAEWTDGTDVLTLKANSGTQGHFQYRTECNIVETGAGQVGVLSGRNFIWGIGALATTATAGFLYIPTSAGAPTGVPGAATGRVPLHYDSTNNRFYVYNGAWRSVALT